MKQFSLEEYLKNPSRKVVTRDGRNVTIHCTNFNYENPIIAEIEGIAHSYSFRSDGLFYSFRKTEYDLFFASEKHDGWINIFGDSNSYAGTDIFKSKEDAEKFGKKYRDYKATIKIKWEK